MAFNIKNIKGVDHFEGAEKKDGKGNKEGKKVLR
jgi:hypothetical protein